MRRLIMSRPIWIYAVCKNLLLSSVAVKELTGLINPETKTILLLYKSWISKNVSCISHFRCAIPGLVNDTYAVQNDFHQGLINLTIPPAQPNDDDEVYDKCHIYTTDGYDSYDGVIGINATSIINRTTITCDRWVYDESVFTSTLAAEVTYKCILYIQKYLPLTVLLNFEQNLCKYSQLSLSQIPKDQDFWFEIK